MVAHSHHRRRHSDFSYAERSHRRRHSDFSDCDRTEDIADPKNRERGRNSPSSSSPPSLALLLKDIQNQDSHTVRNALQTLQQQLIEGEKSLNCDKIARVGGPLIIIKAMEHHEELDISNLGLWALGHLSQDSKLSNLIIKNGGIEAIVLAMTRFPQDTFLQHYGCVALRTILEHDPKQGGTAIIAKGGIHAILKAMENHPQNRGILFHSNSTLHTLTNKHPEGNDAIIRCDGLKVIRNAHSFAKSVHLSAQPGTDASAILQQKRLEAEYKDDDSSIYLSERLDAVLKFQPKKNAFEHYSRTSTGRRRKKNRLFFESVIDTCGGTVNEALDGLEDSVACNGPNRARCDAFYEL